MSDDTRQLISLICAASFLLLIALIILVNLLQMYVSIRMRKLDPEALRGFGRMAPFLKTRLHRLSTTIFNPFENLSSALKWHRAVKVVSFTCYCLLAINGVSFFLFVANSVSREKSKTPHSQISP